MGNTKNRILECEYEDKRVREFEALRVQFISLAPDIT